MVDEQPGDETMPQPDGASDPSPTPPLDDTLAAGAPTVPTEAAATLVSSRAGAAQTLIPAGLGLLALDSDFGPYHIIRELGAGGMGRVYLGEHGTLQRKVAIKVMVAALSQEQAYKERFLREARSAAAVQHPHLVTIHDAGEIDGHLFMALEFVPGGDLAQQVRDQGRLPVSQALTVIRDAALGLQCLEQAGLIHRDIKPNNIFLDDAGRAKLGDFGLARSISNDHDQLTVTGAAIGTPAYMAPEQARGDSDVDSRTDIYALGATLYNLLTGAMPFHGTTPYAIVDQVLHTPAPRLSDQGLDVAPTIERLISRTMAKERDQRFPDCAALIAAIDEALGRRGPDATPATMVDARSDLQSGRPQRPVVTVIVLALLATVAIVAIAAWPDQRPADNGPAATTTPVNQPPAVSTAPAPAAAPSQTPAPQPTVTANPGKVIIGQHVVIGGDEQALTQQIIVAQGDPTIRINAASLDEFTKGWRLVFTGSAIPQDITGLSWRLDEERWQAITPTFHQYGNLAFQTTLPLRSLQGDHRLAVRWVDAAGQEQIQEIPWNDHQQRLALARQLIGDGQQLGIFIPGNQLHEGKIWCSLSSSLSAAHPGLASLRWSANDSSYTKRILFDRWTNFYDRFPDGWDLLVLPIGTEYVMLRIEYIDGSVQECRIDNQHRGSQQELMIDQAREELAEPFHDMADWRDRDWGQWTLNCVDWDETRHVVNRVDYGPDAEHLDRSLALDPERADDNPTVISDPALNPGIALRLHFTDGSTSKTYSIRNDDLDEDLLDAKGWAEENQWIGIDQVHPGRWLIELRISDRQATAMQAIRYGFDQDIPDQQLAVAPGQALPSWLSAEEGAALRDGSMQYLDMPPTAGQLVMQIVWRDGSTSDVRSWDLPATTYAAAARTQVEAYLAGERALASIRRSGEQRVLRCSFLNDRDIARGLAAFTWHCGETSATIIVNDLAATGERERPPREITLPAAQPVTIDLRYTDGQVRQLSVAE